jgi:aspartyl-tRNA(Asn)/glutamyl-tRNA(Gln) amidotransferase subunit A
MSASFRTITEIHDAYDGKKISPEELIREKLAAAQASQLGSVLTLCEDRALAQAREASHILQREGRVPREKMPLFGIPMGIKDALVIEGVRTTAASKMLENYVPPYTATSVARLEAAGAVTLAKLNMDEFAMGGSNENSAFGPVKNPRDPSRVAGGSSGGSAAAVAEGFVTAALGSDTGGSIRLPASFCGVVGMKPTYGRVSRYGLIAFASSLDQVGPFAGNIPDAAAVLDAMSGHDPKDSTSSTKAKPAMTKAAHAEPDWRSLRVGVPKEFFSAGLSSDVEKSIQASLKFFESKGARLVPISLPHSGFAISVYYVVAVSEASSNLARFDGVRYGTRSAGADGAAGLAGFYEASRAGFGAEVKRRIILGTFALSSGYSDAYYKRACQVRALIKRDFDEAFGKVDLIAGPVAPTTAFKLGEKTTDPLQMYLMDIFTIPASLAGLPALSIPCGKDSGGLPIGLHLMAPVFGEEKLVSVAAAFERGAGHG